jgi:integrase
VESINALITKRSVEAIVVSESGEARLWDTKLKGFLVRVYATGRRVYAVRYRAGRSLCTFTIGVHGSPWTADTARKRAQEALDSVRQGQNPAVEKKAARAALTIAELIDRYLEEGPATKANKRASTWAIDGSNLNSHIRPLLGQKIANTLSKADAARAIQDITNGKTATAPQPSGKPRGRIAIKGGEGTARRTRTTAAAMFAWGVEHGHISGANPFASVKLNAPRIRERFLSREEAGKMLDALADLETQANFNRAYGDAIRLLVLTGARKTEILGLRWSEVDFARTTLVLPPERTKAGGKTGERRVVLSPSAIAILSKRRQEVDTARRQAKAEKKEFAEPEFVLPAARGAGHAVGLRRAFTKVCEVAGLPAVRVHDLRHSFASFAIADGASLFLVAKLLGHANVRTAERYAHLSGDPLQDMVKTIGSRLMPIKADGAPDNGVATQEQAGS